MAPEGLNNGGMSLLAQNLFSSINRTLRRNYPSGSDDVTFKAKFAGDLSVNHRARKVAKSMPGAR